MIEDSKLMACPFCGGHVHPESLGFRQNMLCCDYCGMYFALDDIYATEKELETAFNVRHQEQPVKPKVDIDDWVCGECGRKLTQQKKLGDNVLFEDYFNYCPNCGKKVKWYD